MFVTNNERIFFLNHLNKLQKVLEYGSGSSTLEIAPLVKELVSIEHNDTWYSNIKEKIPNNVILILEKPNIPYNEGGHDGTFDEFKNYIFAPEKYGPFDLIFIDGRARVECVKFIKNVSHDETLIFVHDFSEQRLNFDNYGEMHNYLTLIECVDQMAKFKIK